MLHRCCQSVSILFLTTLTPLPFILFLNLFPSFSPHLTPPPPIALPSLSLSPSPSSCNHYHTLYKHTPYKGMSLAPLIAHMCTPHALTCSPTAALTHSCPHPQLHSPTAALTHCCTHPQLHPPTAAPTHSCTHPQLHPPTAAPTHLCTHPHLHSSISALIRQSSEHCSH